MSGDELKEAMAHWAGRVWFHAHEMPDLKALRSFDLKTVQRPFRKYVREHGESFLDIGMTVEEIWASQQLYSAAPILVIISPRFADLLTPRIEPTRVHSSQAIVFTHAAMCFSTTAADGGSYPLLVTDGEIGHTIYIQGVNGITFEHPRGVEVQPGWLSFHDPWPARSLLAPERNFAGVQVLEDVTRPPRWLISPADLDKIVVGHLVPIDALRALHGIFVGLEAVIESHARSSQPLWLDPYEGDKYPMFRFLFEASGHVAPMTAEALMGLGRVSLLRKDLETARNCFAGADRLGAPAVRLRASAAFSEAGYDALAQEWRGPKPSR
jgi:hypothetical protein